MDNLPLVAAAVVDNVPVEELRADDLIGEMHRVDMKLKKARVTLEEKTMEVNQLKDRLTAVVQRIQQRKAVLVSTMEDLKYAIANMPADKILRVPEYIDPKLKAMMSELGASLGKKVYL